MANRVRHFMPWLPVFFFMSAIHVPAGVAFSAPPRLKKIAVRGPVSSRIGYPQVASFSFDDDQKRTSVVLWSSSSPKNTDKEESDGALASVRPVWAIFAAVGILFVFIFYGIGLPFVSPSEPLKTVSEWSSLAAIYSALLALLGGIMTLKMAETSQQITKENRKEDQQLAKENRKEDQEGAKENRKEDLELRREDREREERIRREDREREERIRREDLELRREDREREERIRREDLELRREDREREERFRREDLELRREERIEVKIADLHRQKREAIFPWQGHAAIDEDIRSETAKLEKIQARKQPT